MAAIAYFLSHVRFASAFWAFLFGPGRLFGCIDFALPIRFQFLGSRCVRLKYRALWVDTSLRIRLLPAYRADFAARFETLGSGLLFAHPTTLSAIRAEGVNKVCESQALEI